MFKFNISTKDGKTYKLEAEALGLIQKQLGDVIKGEEISPDLAGYELKITGTSDLSGFASMEEVEGIGLKKVLLTYGKGLHKRPKGLTKKGKAPIKGLRMRKTVRGKIISEAISQINTAVIKQGSKKLSEIFPEQNKIEAPPAQEQAESVVESPQQKEQKAELANPEQEPKEKLPPKAEEQVE
ncbi:MAG TPA: S6e family ribosomal protein [Candidatus Nanoarchaeia archaeon]|nr:S6e family ribosomal protein [Candidatus Nanoarchaeia archaeon]